MQKTKEIQLNQGEQLRCPHCGREQESTVEDYVVPFRVGAASTTRKQCEHCDAESTTSHLGDGQYSIKPIVG